MTRPAVVLRRAVVLALGATLLLAVPASAHPYVQGGEAPVDSLASLVLDIAHGCTADEAGDDHAEGPEEPTTEVALEVHEQMRVVDVPDTEGFDIDLETDTDGNVEVVVWTATTSTEPAPQLPFDAVFTGEPGDELYLRVFQGCEDLSSRWVGTPDEPAEEPAIRLLLVEADPDSPPPPEEELTDAEDPQEDPQEEAAADEESDETAAQDRDADIEPAPATVPNETEDSPLLWIIVALVGAALLLAVILSLRRRPVAAVSPTAIEGDDLDGPSAEAPHTPFGGHTAETPTAESPTTESPTTETPASDDPTVVDDATHDARDLDDQDPR